MNASMVRPALFAVAMLPSAAFAQFTCPGEGNCLGGGGGGFTGYCCGDVCCLHPGQEACYPQLERTTSAPPGGQGLCCADSAGFFACNTYDVSNPNDNIWTCCPPGTVCGMDCEESRHDCVDAAQVCPPEPPCDDCDEFGDPISGSKGNSVLDVADVHIVGVMGGLRFERHWTSRPQDWADDAPFLLAPKPFGGSPNQPEHPEWSHNFMATVVVSANGQSWSVRKPRV